MHTVHGSDSRLVETFADATRHRKLTDSLLGVVVVIENCGNEFSLDISQVQSILRHAETTAGCD